MQRPVLCFLASVLALVAQAGLPEPVIPEGVGVNIHFVTGHEKDLDMIAAAGFRYVRMDFTWAGIERKKGEYDWAGYDELLRHLESRKLKALFILDYSNPLYEDSVTSGNPIDGQVRKTTAAPQKPESIAAFARWAGAAAARYAGRSVLWEIWNEPNIQFWPPKPDVEQYIRLASATCEAVRSNAPQATLVAPATSGFPWEFLEKVLQSGLLSILDAVSVHPYRDYKSGPETAAKDYKRLRELIDKHAPPGKKIPILSGEWGYATHDKGVTPETQAAFAVRQQLANLLYDVPLSIWYDWKNDGPDPAEREHNFGTVNQDLTPKPAYHALQVMTRELTGFRVAGRLPLEAPQQFVLLCTNAAGMKKLAAWSTEKPDTLKLQVDTQTAKPARVTLGNGETTSAKMENGKLILELQSLPAYVSFE